MAAAIGITYQALPPRRTLAASVTTPTWRMPPRVYTPFPARVLRRPMAVHVDREERHAGPDRRRGLFSRVRAR